MENVKIEFQIIPSGKRPPNDFHYVDCFMVFEINIGDFWRKAYLVVEGYLTHTPDVITYFCIDTGEAVFIAIAMAALHNLEVKAA